MDRDQLAAVLQAVLDTHDVLRARARRRRRAACAAARSRGGRSTCWTGRRSIRADGVMVSAWWDGAALQLVVHHLVIDGVSWRILADDLATAWEAVRDGRAPVLPPVPTSFRGWSQRLHSAPFDDELRHWRAVPRRPTAARRTARWTRPATPAPPPRTTTVTLPPEVTASAARRGARRARCRVDDVLLRRAVALAVARRRGPTLGAARRPGGPRPARGASTGTDLTRTVGWFTSIYPVLIDPGP